MTPIRQSEFAVNIDRRNNPPMPIEEFKRVQLVQFARVIAGSTLAALLFAGVIAPWKQEWVAIPFAAAFLVGAWVLATRRAQ